MDYFGNRHKEQYIFKCVSWDNWMEHGTYDYITEGNIELSTESDLVATGSFSFEGYEVPDTNDLIRVYYRFHDDLGKVKSHALATFFTSYSGLNYTDTTNGIKASGTLEGESVLSVLQRDVYGAPFTVKMNENAIYKAQDLIRQHGLNVNYEPSVYSLASDHTFDAGTDYLEIVRWLCEQAGYVIYPDEYGTVQLQDHKKLQQKPVKITFKNDSKSIMYPELETQNDWQETPNVYQLLYNVDDCCMIATAKNVSGSRASLSQRGNREYVQYEETGELPTEGDRLRNLMDKAADGLQKISVDTEYVSFKHAWYPMYVYDQIAVKYADMEWQGELENTAIELSPATETQSKIKRVLSDNIQIEKTARYLRGGNDENQEESNA